MNNRQKMQIKQISFNYSINNVFFQVNNRIEFTCLFYLVFKRKLNTNLSSYQLFVIKRYQ